MRSILRKASFDILSTAPNSSSRRMSHEPSLHRVRYSLCDALENNFSNSLNIIAESDINEVNVKHKEPVQGAENVKMEKVGFLQKVARFFGLSVLKDPIFVNILIGLSVAFSAEMNFTFLVPFILKDMLEFETNQIGQVMAVIGFSDTFFRLLSPFAGEWSNQPARVLYLIGLVMIILVRTGKYFPNNTVPSFICNILLLPTLIPLSGVGTTCFLSCCDKDSAIVFTTSRLSDVNSP
jgi:hypothetical protein